MDAIEEEDMKKILRLFFGIVFVCAGISSFATSIGTGLIGLVIGLALLFPDISKAMTEKRRKDQKAQVPAENPVTTFTCMVTGTRFECRFPSGKFTDRQQVLNKLRIGDLVTLKKTEWEGEPAFAVMSTLYGVDIGMIPANNVSKVAKLYDQYQIVGKLTEFSAFEVDGTSYTGCSVELDCYDK